MKNLPPSPNHHRKKKSQPSGETTTTKKLANWKSPGINQVQNFWVSYLTALHPTLIKNANEIINKPETAPQWLTTGTTTLIHKSGPTNNAKSYRPITCLPTYYKTITLMLTDKIYTHLTSKKFEQPMESLAQTPYHSSAEYSKATCYPPYFFASPSPQSQTYSREMMWDTKSKKPRYTASSISTTKQGFHHPKSNTHRL